MRRWVLTALVPVALVVARKQSVQREEQRQGNREQDPEPPLRENLERPDEHRAMRLTHAFASSPAPCGSGVLKNELCDAAILLRMTLLRPRVDALLPVPAVAPRPPLVHVPA